MGKKRIRKNKIKFPKLFHLHLSATGLLFASYIIFSLIWSPEFLLSDIRMKFRAVADEMVAISARVVNPPQKPVVSANAVCDSGNLYVSLDWDDDTGSDSFDVERDGSPLVTGITSSQYNDSNVTVASTYTYLVTARGSMGSGFAVSDPVTVAMPSECNVQLPAPNVVVTGVHPGNIDAALQKIETTSKTPIIYGTTNVGNAIIDIMILGNINVISQTTASSNGYWQWKAASALPYGDYSFFVTVTDPNDSLRTVSKQFTLNISKEKGEGSEKKKEKPDNISSTLLPIPQQENGNDNQNIGEQEMPASPLEYELGIKNNEVLQGKNLDTCIVIKDVDEKFVGREAIVRYLITDAKGKLISEEYADIVLERGQELEKYLPIAKSMLAGGYKLSAEIIFSDYNVSRSADFEVLALPIVKLGGGFVINYQDLLSDMGTISIWLLIALLIWLGILSREYWLSAHALRHITEKSLESWGMVPLQKRRK